MAQLTKTQLFGHLSNLGLVILTEGMVNATTGARIYGAFRNETDARSTSADCCTLATIGAERLTPQQIEIARRNSESLAD